MARKRKNKKSVQKPEEPGRLLVRKKDGNEQPLSAYWSTLLKKDIANDNPISPSHTVLALLASGFHQVQLDDGEWSDLKRHLRR